MKKYQVSMHLVSNYQVLSTKNHVSKYQLSKHQEYKSIKYQEYKSIKYHISKDRVSNIKYQSIIVASIKHQV